MKHKTVTEKKISKKPFLNPRQLDFCKQYMIDFNGTQAAIRAGYSEHTANEQASQLLAKLNIQTEINRLREIRDDNLEASRDFVIRELMLLAKFDIKDAFNSDGSLKDINSMPPEITKCLASIEIKDLFEGYGKDREQIGFTKTIRAWNKVQALELLGAHFGLFERTGTKDPKKEAAEKKLDLLQVIKLVAKDGQVTTITNRLSPGASESPIVAVSRPRGLVVVGRTSEDSRVDSPGDKGE